MQGPVHGCRHSPAASSTEIVEFNEDISVEAASESRTSEAIALKIRAVEYMAVNNKAELKVLIEELENWQPCAASLRNSGIAHIFDDHTVWAIAAFSERAFALRTRFLKTMRQNRRRGSSESAIPFGDASMRQFKQNVDSMEAFVQEKDVNAEDPGLYRRLAYHLVMNNFTVPQALEGLSVDLCRSFTKTAHEGVILARAIANGTAVSVDNRDRMIMARTSELGLACNSKRMANAWEIFRHWNKK